MLHDQSEMMLCSRSEKLSLALFSVDCSVNCSHGLINLIVEVRLTYSQLDKGNEVFDCVIETKIRRFEGWSDEEGNLIVASSGFQLSVDSKMNHVLKT